MRSLFVEVPVEEMDTVQREFYGELTKASVRCSVWRHVPTGRVGIVIHNGREPRPETFQNAADFNLMFAETGSRA